jgi:hypothetical protein
MVTNNLLSRPFLKVIWACLKMISVLVWCTHWSRHCCLLVLLCLVYCPMKHAPLLARPSGVSSISESSIIFPSPLFFLLLYLTLFNGLFEWVLLSDRSSYYHNLPLFLYPVHVHFSSIGLSDVCVVCTLASATTLFYILVSGSFLSQRII